MRTLMADGVIVVGEAKGEYMECGSAEWLVEGE